MAVGHRERSVVASEKVDVHLISQEKLEIDRIALNHISERQIISIRQLAYKN